MRLNRHEKPVRITVVAVASVAVGAGAPPSGNGGAARRVSREPHHAFAFTSGQRESGGPGHTPIR